MGLKNEYFFVIIYNTMLLPLDIWQHVIAEYLNFTARVALLLTCREFRPLFMTASNYFDQYYIYLNLHTFRCLQEEAPGFIKYISKNKINLRNCTSMNIHHSDILQQIKNKLLSGFSDQKLIYTQLEKIEVKIGDVPGILQMKELLFLLNLESAKLLMNKLVAIAPDLHADFKYRHVLYLSYEILYNAALVYYDEQLVDWFASNYGHYVEQYQIELNGNEQDWDLYSVYKCNKTPQFIIERNNKIIAKYEHLFRKSPLFLSRRKNKIANISY